MPHMRDDAVPAEREVTEFPIPVANDYDQLVRQADLIAKVIDRHLDFEESAQGMSMTPKKLCPDQRIDLISDLAAIAK